MGAVALREEHIGAVMMKVVGMQKKGWLDIPPDYSVGNSLNSAWLMLQDVVDKEKQPALAVCTKESISYSLLKMCIQGLNPAKNQGYFIVYGNKLVFQRSYFGTIAVLKRVDPRVADVVAEIVYQGDAFKYKIVRGQKIVTDHEQALENIDGTKIKAAYCIIYDQADEVLDTTIMTMTELMQSWKQSRQYPITNDGKIKPDSVHGKFTAEMAKKTVINRACKILIDASDDSSILTKTAQEAGREFEEIVAQEQIEANANKKELPPIESGPETKLPPAATQPAPEPPDPPIDLPPSGYAAPEECDQAGCEVVDDMDPGF